MSALLRIAIATLAMLFSVDIAAYDVQSSYKTRFDNRVLTPVDGLWLWSSGAIVAIETNVNGNMRLTLVESPDPAIDTPTVIGTGRFTGDPNKFELKLKRNPNGKNSSERKTYNFVAELSHDNQLSLEPKKTGGLKLNLWRLLPYLFRMSVVKTEKDTPTDGAIKIWPSTGHPQFPVIL